MLLAIDPGYKNMGYCVGCLNTIKIVSSGTIQPNAKYFPDQLLQLHNSLTGLIAKYKITKAIYEKPVFINRGETGVKVQQSIAILLCCLAANNISEIHTLTPNQVKQKITGNGKADKLEIQSSIKKYFPNIVFKTDHESDSVAMFICYLNKL